MQPVGAVRAPVCSGAALLELIAGAKARRATCATGANAVSSRSHAVCQLTLRPHPARVVAAAERGRTRPPRAPVLTMVDGGHSGGRRRTRYTKATFLIWQVDCAGSERKEDSAYHTADRRKEGSEINQSLHALKECMRYVGEVDLVIRRS